MLQRIDCPGLVRRLLAKGFTTKALGDALGLSQPSVSRLARGRTESTSDDVMVRLIHLVGGEIRLPPELIGPPPTTPTQEASHAG